MSDAPERISLLPNELPDFRDTHPTHDSTEYVRADLSPQWQTIDSAPRDGTWILGWRKRKALEDQIEAWQFTADTSNQWFWVNSADTTDYDEEPTHWKPLGPDPT